jgi:AcrR family transcriptional regulator
MPRTKEQYEKIRQEKRQLIKETALSLFAANGYEATSISDIACSARISKGLMYNYFTSKEELLETIWNELITVFDKIIDTDNNGEITDSEAEYFIDSVFEILTNRREYWKLYFQLSFQPKVIEFLMNIFNTSKIQERQNLMFRYFSQKLNFASPEIGYFSIRVFIKGLSMIISYTESIYSNDFLNNYKVWLKKMIFKESSNNVLKK